MLLSGTKAMSYSSCASHDVFYANMRFVFIIYLLSVPLLTEANTEGDALHAFRRNLVDPAGILASWDPSLVNPCTWFHVTCNSDDHVIRVDLGSGTLSGQLVGDLGSLLYLEYLELFGNNLSGGIPAELGNLTNLISLDLYQNSFNGSIPRSLGELRNLKYLRMDHNSLTGEIPVELTSIPNILVVKLSYNNLTGTVPPFASTVITSFDNNPYLTVQI